jgi:secreted trypsin-like serine protease
LNSFNGQKKSFFYFKEPVEFSSMIGPICLPPTVDFDYSNSFATAIGWGVSFYGSKNASSVKKDVKIIINSDMYCWIQYMENNYDYTVEVCGGEMESYGGTCQGDSGGPLVVLNQNDDSYYLYGITSHGYGCGYVSVFTRVSAFIEWINENIEP